MKKLLFLMSVLLLPACATHMFDVSPAQLAEEGSQFGDSATVYVIRDNTFAYSLWSVEAQVDGTGHGSLRRAQYLRIPVTPGSHELVAAYPLASGIQSVGVKGEFAARHTYYFLFSTGVGGNAPVGGISVQYGFIQLSKEQAKARLDKYKDKTETR